MNKGEPNLVRKQPLPQSTLQDTSLNGAGDGGSYKEVVNDHPTYSASAGLPNNHITSRGLNSNDTAGVISQPSFVGGMPDNMIQSSQNVSNAEAMGELNNGYSGENRSAQWKNRSQDIPDKGRNQYNTPQ